MSPAAGCAIRIEVLFLRTEGVEATLSYRFTSACLSGEQCPDDAAAALARAEGRGTEIDVLHSTSWRYEAGAGVVLTYAALPDPDRDAAASVLTGPTVVASGDPRRPSPDLVHSHHVAAHAVRHLSDLAERDPAIAAVARGAEHRPLFDAMAAAARGTPTGTHAEVHAAVDAGQPPSRSAHELGRVISPGGHWT